MSTSTHQQCSCKPQVTDRECDKTLEAEMIISMVSINIYYEYVQYGITMKERLEHCCGNYAKNLMISTDVDK